MSSKKSKIPVKSFEPLFKIVSDLDRNEENSSKVRRPKSSRRDYKLRTASANVESRGRSLERLSHREKWKEMQYALTIRDNQIQDLVEKLQILSIENERLNKEKLILVENYNALYGKYENKNQLLNNTVTKNTNNKVDQIKNFSQANENFKKENEDMKYDINMLKILVFRLNKHLEYYQDLLRENGIKSGGSSKLFHSDDLEIKWGSVNSHVLAPLLNSYEERIQEKNDLIQSYEEELNNITGKLKDILEENEKIHELYDILHKNSESWVQERQRLKSSLDIMKNKATIQSKRADLAREKLVEIMKVYEHKIASQSIDIERLQEAYNRAKGEITTLKGFQKNPEVVVESIRECQKLFEELKAQYEHEKVKFNEDRKHLEDQLQKERTKLESLEKDYFELKTISEKQKICNETLNEKNRALKQNLQKSRQSNTELQSDVDFGKDKYKESWNNLSKLHDLIQEKEITIQNLRMHQKMEVDELKRKLHQRDQTLKKVLEVKISSTKERQNLI